MDDACIPPPIFPEFAKLATGVPAKLWQQGISGPDCARPRSGGVAIRAEQVCWLALWHFQVTYLVAF